MAKKVKDAAASPPAAEIDYTSYATKPPTDLQRRFADWLVEKTGITFATKKEMDAFREGVRLGVALRIPFQASPENQAVRAEKAAEVPAEKPAKAAPVKATKAAKAAKATAAPSVPDPDDADAAEPVTPAKKAGRRAPVSKAAAAAAGKRPAPF